jgi:hypothetical protein
VLPRRIHVGTLRAWKSGYSTDSVVKRARKRYLCQACGCPIEKGQRYERYMGCPVHEGAALDPGPNCPVDPKVLKPIANP